MTLGNSLTTIGRGAFLACEGLTRVEFPETVTKVGNGAFGRTNIATVKINGNIYDFDEDSFNRSPVSKIVAAEGVDRILRDMVVCKTSIKCMEIPESVNYIDDDAFNGVQSGFYILGVPGSFAEKFAKEHGIKFVSNAFMYGDIDGDKEVKVGDALMALQAAVGKIALDDEALAAADVDGKEGVSVADALCILQYAVGKIQKFPAEQ